MIKEDEQVLLTLKELSDFLKFSESTLYTYVCQKKIPYYKLGSRVRFLKSEILEWLSNKKCAVIG